MARGGGTGAAAAGLALAALLAGCGGGGGTVAADAGAPALTDEEGRVVVYRGVNFSGAAKTAAGDTAALAEADLDRLQAWGVTLVRYLVFWAAIEPTAGARDEDYLARVEAQVRRLTARGIDVFLDLHQDLFGVGFGADGAPRFACPEERYAAYVPKTPWFLNYASAEVSGCFDWLFGHEELWDAYRDAAVALAARLADEPRVVGFDVMNEPYFGSAAPAEFEPGRLLPFYQRVGEGLRAAAPGRRLFLEPSLAHTMGFATALPPLPADAVYAPHYYPTANETGDYTGDRAAIARDLDAMGDEAARLGAPWLLGEAGIINDRPHGADYLRDLLDALDARFGSVTLWDYGPAGAGSWALVDETGAPHAVADAVVRPYGHRIAGRPVAMSYDATSGAFELSWAERGVRAPTVIVLPPARYPQPQVTLGDPRDTFAHDPAAGRLTVSGDPGVAVHAVRVTP
ncbi:MAG TPA: cellulase family glycosylhydrolase [Polyangia bacterium]|jgi:endoglycosylceramidase